MSNSLVKICQMIETVGTFQGTTKLHKIAYVAQVLGYPLHEHFEWYPHGPYSPSLALKLEQLISSRLVKEQERKTGKYDTRMYSLTRLGRSFLKSLGQGAKIKGNFEHLVAELHTKRRARDMELVDSILFWEGLGQSRADAVRTVVRAKPKFAGREGEIRQALEDIEILRQHYAADGARGDEAEAS